MDIVIGKTGRVFPLWHSGNESNYYRTWVQSLALFSGLRIWHRHELWWRSQTWLLNADFQRIARRDKKAFLSDHAKK